MEKVPLQDLLPLSTKIQTNSQLLGAEARLLPTKWTIKGQLAELPLRFKTSIKMPNSSNSSNKSNYSCKLMNRPKRHKNTPIRVL